MPHQVTLPHKLRETLAATELSFKAAIGLLFPFQITMFAASAKPAESSIGSASDRITAAPSRRGKHAPPEKTHCPMLKEQTGKYEGDEGLGHEESEFDRQLASYKAPQYVDFSHVVGFRDGQEDGPVAWSDFDGESKSYPVAWSNVDGDCH